MKVGYFLHSFHPQIGGIESFSLGLARLALSLGHEVHVFAPRRGPALADEEWNGLQVHRLALSRPRWPGFPHAITPGLFRQADAVGLDLLHAFEYRNWQPVVAARLARKRRLPFVWSTAFHPSHRGWSEPPLRGLYDATLGRSIVHEADVVAYLSEREMDALAQTHPAARRKASLELPPLLEEGPAPGGLADLDLPEGRFALFLGRIEEYKGPWLAIEALARLPADVRLVIAGPLTEQDRVSLAGHARRAGVADRVVPVGAVSEAQKVALLRSCTLFLNLANYESFGISLVEALREGATVLSTPVGIAPELVRSPDQIVEERTVGGLADRWGALWRDDGKVEQASPAELRQRFGPDVLRGKLAAAYRLAAAASS